MNEMLRVSATHMLNHLRDAIHFSNRQAGWWSSVPEGTLPSLERQGLCLALIHSEVSEALEGIRKGLKDDKLPHRPAAEVELADVLIRVFDFCGAMDYDIGGALTEKLAYNQTRADHKPENRAAPGGKAF